MVTPLAKTQLKVFVAFVDVVFRSLSGKSHHCRLQGWKNYIGSILFTLQLLRCNVQITDISVVFYFLLGFCSLKNKKKPVHERSHNSIMAVDSFCEKEHQNREFLDGNGSIPVGYSSLELLKPNVDDLNQQFPLEIPPILFEETSIPTGLRGSHARDVYSISVLPEPEEGVNANCASSLAFLSILEVLNQSKSSLCLDAHLNCQNCIDFQMKSEDVYSHCIIDIPNVNGNSISSESHEEGVERLKTGNSPTSVLWTDASLKVGGRPMQSLMNLSNSRDKSVTEKAHDIPSNRWRRYKRVASFDSRKVALLFSILSSLGTLVLIYLTLRVRQRADSFVLI